MELRSFKKEDMDQVLKLIDFARASLRKDGVDQWQKSSPNRDLLRRQLRAKEGMVLDDRGVIQGYGALSESEATYNRWEYKFRGKDYFVVHTFMAHKENTKGLGSIFMEKIIAFARKEGKDSLRIDTHEDNFRMRGLLNKFDFTYIGHIEIMEEGKAKDRICFEKIL
ncbi:GNAT family N-acetyltransferase [Anaerococcus sp. AGMB09787]|uniref:GNAT family N-acetyltransferase n=1 Tax=Anaerococcus sp. AGMB09787 TaxID=2922869 RepID=UPI001FAEDB1F|nr:GNAT family N-acetyltransferase [Anaerococcus sp. AGMB09787]